MTPSQISELLGILQRTVKRYSSQFQRTGDVIPDTRTSNGPPRLLQDLEQLYLLRLVINNPTIYLHEIQTKLQARFGETVSLSTICNTIHLMGFTRQVVRSVALQQSELMRAKFMAEVSVYSPEMLIWIDESGYDRRCSLRKYGYGLRGIRPVKRRLLVRGVRYSTIPVMSINGIEDVLITEGTINGDRFSYFIRTCLLPLLQPFNNLNPMSVVIMDNASIHHTENNVQLIENTGARLLFLPPYSPDLNPLEQVFSKVKAICKENEALLQVCSSPRSYIAIAFSMISTDDSFNFIKHCGYLDNN